MLEGIIIWGVVWLIGAWLGAWIITLLGVVVGDALDNVAPIIIGWILAVVWWGFAIIQVILQIVALVQFLS